MSHLRDFLSVFLSLRSSESASSKATKLFRMT